MVMRIRTTAFLAIAIVVAGPAWAEKPRSRPELFSTLINCRAIADDAQRLACYDAATGAMEEAEKKQDLVVVDRQEIRETRKSLFGFTLPKIGLFGPGKADDKDEISQIESVLLSARSTAGGNWSLVLAEDAGTWETVSAITVAPRAGDRVRIRKASLGSYLGAVGLNRGVRFRRVN